MKLKNAFKVGIVPLCTLSLLACNRIGSNDGKVLVTFKNYDGTVLQKERVVRGKGTSYHQTNIPKKPIEGNEVANKFIGWDKSLDKVTKDTVFTAQYQPITSYIDNDHDGIPAEIDPNGDNNNEFTYDAKSYVYLENQKIKIDFSKFLETDANTSYHNDIAKLGLMMSNPKVNFKDDMFNEKSYGGRENALYSRLGCDEWHHFDFREYAAENYKYDPYDTTSGVYGHKYLVDSNGNAVRDFIFIAFEGTHGAERWSSNFDIGYDDKTQGDDYSKVYYEKVARTGIDSGKREDHPEWDEAHKDYHKGFYVAAKRVLKERVDGPEGEELHEGPVKFLKYIEEHTTPGLEAPIIFITGHSRGGAMANIVGTYIQKEYIEQGHQCVPFTYTFASPATYGADIIQADTVFNVINSDDIVTMVPYSEWGFTRNGTDVLVKSIVDDHYESIYNKNRDGRKYYRITGADHIFHNIGCKGRDQFYDYNFKDGTGEEEHTRYLSGFALNDESYDSEEKANTAITNDIKPYYDRLLGDYSKQIGYEVVERETLLGTKYYDVYAKLCLSSITSVVQGIMTGNQQIINNLTDILHLLSNGRFIEFALGIGLNIINFDPFFVNADPIALPHDYGSYTVILNNYVEPQP